MPSQEDIEAQKELLAAHRRTLSIYLRQLAITGVPHAPPAVLSGIQDARNNIKQIKNNLHSWGVAFEDQLDDEELPLVNKEIDDVSSVLETMAEQGTVYFVDAWTVANSQEELELKTLLKSRNELGWECFQSQQYDNVVRLYEPLLKNAFFTVGHPHWRDKPFFLSYILNAKAHLFISYAHLCANDWETYIPKAFELLPDICSVKPYSMKGGSAERLPAETALIQNLNYKDYLLFALDWIDKWGWSFLNLANLTPEQATYLEETIKQRIKEIDFFIQLRTQ